jgi:hypothetical protein
MDAVFRSEAPGDSTGPDVGRANQYTLAFNGTNANVEG